MRNELEDALQSTTESLSQATRLLALVSAPSLDAATVRHVEVLLLQPARRHGRGDHVAAGGVTKRVVRARRPGRRRARGLGARVPERAGRRAAPRNERRSGGASTIRAAHGASGRFSSCFGPPSPTLAAEQGAQLYVGGAAGLLGDARGAELEACQRLLELLERRAAVLELLSDALDPRRTVVRVGPEFDGGQLHDVAYVGAAYGLTTRSLGAVGLLGPLRMDYEKAIRSVRAAAFELSRLVEDVYEETSLHRRVPLTRGDDGAGLLRDPRRRSRTRGDAEIKRAFRRLARELHPDVCDAPDAERTLPRGRRGLRGALEPRARELYDRYGHAGLRRGGYTPGDVRLRRTSPTSSPPSSARALFGRPAHGARPARGADVTAAVGDLARRSVRGHDVARAGPRRRRLRALRAATAPSPGRSRSAAPSCAGAGRVQQCRRACSASSSARALARAATVAAGSSRRPCDPLRRAPAGCWTSGRSTSTCLPESTTGSASACAERGMPASLGGAAGDVFVLVRVATGRAARARRRRSPRRRSSVTMVEAALGTGVSVPTPEGRSSSSCRPGRSRATSSVVRGGACPRSASGRRGDLRVHVAVRVPRAAHGGAARRCSSGSAPSLGRRRLPRRRRLLRPAEERLPLTATDARRPSASPASTRASRRRPARRDCSTSSPRERSEESRSAADDRSEHASAYVEPAGESRRWRDLDAVPRARQPCPARSRRRAGWEDRWRAFHHATARGGGLWIGPPVGDRRRATAGGGDRARPGVRDRRASDHAALHRAAGAHRAWQPARRRLRLGCPRARRPRDSASGP